MCIFATLAKNASTPPACLTFRRYCSSEPKVADRNLCQFCLRYEAIFVCIRHLRASTNAFFRFELSRMVSIKVSKHRFH